MVLRNYSIDTAGVKLTGLRGHQRSGNRIVTPGDRANHDLNVLATTSDRGDWLSAKLDNSGTLSIEASGAA